MKRKLGEYFSKDYLLRYIKPLFKCSGTFHFQDQQMAFIGNFIYDVGLGYIVNQKNKKIYVWGPPAMRLHDGKEISTYLSRRNIQTCFYVSAQSEKRYVVVEKMKQVHKLDYSQTQHNNLEKLIDSLDSIQYS